MKKNLLTLIVFTLTFICYGQDTTIRYYKNLYPRDEVPKEKAKYAEVIINNLDGSVTTSIKNLRKDVIEHSETFKGDEPMGTWIYLSGKGPKEIDYSFPLIYLNQACKEEIPELQPEGYLKENNSLGYKSPKISDEYTSIIHFLARNIIYPAGAMSKNIQGAVQVAFSILEDGSIDNIYVQKGVNILLDKEAVRVIRKLKFSNPPTLDGVAKKICVSLPVKFKLGS